MLYIPSIKLRYFAVALIFIPILVGCVYFNYISNTGTVVADVPATALLDDLSLQDLAKAAAIRLATPESFVITKPTRFQPFTLAPEMGKVLINLVVIQPGLSPSDKDLRSPMRYRLIDAQSNQVISENKRIGLPPSKSSSDDIKIKMSLNHKTVHNLVRTTVQHPGQYIMEVDIEDWLLVMKPALSVVVKVGAEEPDPRVVIGILGVIIMGIILAILTTPPEQRKFVRRDR